MLSFQSPGVVSAGAFSLFSSLFSQAEAGPVATAQAPERNSQTLALLNPAKHHDPNPSRGGGDITVEDSALVSGAGPAGDAAHSINRPPSADQISVYVVREGDSLSQIASMFNVSVNTIVWANDLKRGVPIHEGQTLLILPISGIQYTIKKGDTLASIAKAYGGDETEILQFNGLGSSAELVVGANITIPGGAEPAPAEPIQKKTSTKVVVSAGVGKASKSSAGYFTNPVPGSIKTQGIHGNNGVDFGAPEGTPVLAAASGQIIISRSGGWNGGYGNYVVISHANGTQTLYGHLVQAIAWEGQSVVKGQVIGYVGSTGRSTGPHLHFEVRGARNPF